MADPPPMLKPRPRRPFELTSTPTDTSDPPTPSPRDSQDSVHSESRHARGKSPGRTRSILNLTSSTLLGIYAPTENAPTPFGNGSQTPLHRGGFDDHRLPVIGAFLKESETARRQTQHQHPHPPHTTLLGSAVPVALRTLLLFGFGVAYGVIIIHLHDNRRIAPVKVEGIERYSWRYLVLWGAAGVLLGRLLPLVDWLWDETVGTSHRDCPSPEHPDQANDGGHERGDEGRSTLGSRFTSTADWNPVVRSIGAFVGIAFAIVTCPILSLHQGPVSSKSLTSSLSAAETSLAIHPPSLPYPGPRQPGALVPDRPLQTRLHAVYHCRHRRHRRPPRHQSRDRPVPCPTLGTVAVSGERGFCRWEAVRETQSSERREHRREHVDCERVVLQQRVFWEHWTKIGV